MKSVSSAGTQAGMPSTGGVALGRRVHGAPRLPWDRTGTPAAAIAAGLVAVWSTIRLLMTRGWESNDVARLLRVASGRRADRKARR